MRHSGEVQFDSPATLLPPRHRVVPGAKQWWTIRALMGVAMLLLPQLVALMITGMQWLLATLIATAALGAVYVVVMPRLRYRVHRWEALPEAVYTLTGWLSREWRVAPLSRIQTIDTQRGPLQQLLGLATVTITTASAAGPLKIDGLDADDAAQLARSLTEETNRTAGDAT
ncbi:MAG: rane-flanked domain protein [Pseudonocardia sp.]|nr:rane-flanked domain protein [Pseudonocardia sp.]